MALHKITQTHITTQDTATLDKITLLDITQANTIICELHASLFNNTRYSSVCDKTHDHDKKTVNELRTTCHSEETHDTT